LSKFINAETYTVIGDLLDVAEEQAEASCSEKFISISTTGGMRKVNTTRK
jgi:hypothetical protein